MARSRVKVVVFGVGEVCLGKIGFRKDALGKIGAGEVAFGKIRFDKVDLFGFTANNFGVRNFERGKVGEIDLAVLENGVLKLAGFGPVDADDLAVGEFRLQETAAGQNYGAEDTTRK